MFKHALFLGALHTDVNITDEYQEQDRTFSTGSDNYPRDSLTGCDDGFENVQVFMLNIQH